MTTNYYRCPTCGAIEHAADLRTPWAGVGWRRDTVPCPEPIFVVHLHPGQQRRIAEPLSELPREVVLS